MKSLTRVNQKIELEVARNNLYAALPPNIRLVLEKPYKCDKCGKRFTAHRYVREHKIEVHSY